MDTLSQHYLMDEQALLLTYSELFQQYRLDEVAVKALASDLIETIRQSKPSSNLFQAFLQEYHLGTKEGVLLMCLAESLVRIPDSGTANKLIEDKLTSANWQQHLGNSDSFWVNASSYGLMLSGHWLGFKKEAHERPQKVLQKLIKKTGEPIVRAALQKSMRLMGKQFVIGETIQDALRVGQSDAGRLARYSFDMLGEGAVSRQDAEGYYDAYLKAITSIGKIPESDKSRMSISIKLSALHPRYETLKKVRVMTELFPRCLELVQMAQQNNVSVTIDAEEVERLELSLEVFKGLMQHPSLSGWQQLGLAVQAYQLRALEVLKWLKALSRDVNKQIPVRLVKGAYWDSEIKWAQQMGLASYPVFTQKAATDLSYLVCARYLLDHPDAFFGQFASHNAHTVSSIVHCAQEVKNSDYEFQRLHGMGESLYAALAKHHDIPCRVYGPVGHHKELLPYLIRRLLENGANSSFVHQITDRSVSIEHLIEEPALKLKRNTKESSLPLPPNLFGEKRRNSQGFNLQVPSMLAGLQEGISCYQDKVWVAKPTLAHLEPQQKKVTKKAFSPQNREYLCGEVSYANEDDVKHALNYAQNAFNTWSRTPVQRRTDLLLACADALEAHRYELMALCIREAGKTYRDALDEVREAVDFCRYYAQQAKRLFAKPLSLPGPTGEKNELYWQGCGVFVCISPWNFPVAIFTGQIVAALVAGNTVVAKPADQTSLVAAYVVNLLHSVGVPKDVLQLIPGQGRVIGDLLVKDERVAGVVFTGSTGTAKRIQLNLAQKSGSISRLIAETGGQNAMIVDSSALSEQVIKDVIHSAFNSAGQRCSALRLLFLQEDIADALVASLKGAMDELAVGDPSDSTTDVGPVIDEASRDTLNQHIDAMKDVALSVYQPPQNAGHKKGVFVAPTLIELKEASVLKQEIFGPVLHVVRYDADDIDSVIKTINETGYGLTLGIHSRIESFAEYIKQRVHVGNIYINRNMVGAVVGVQPFGGQGLSGTGPKAGGPHYLQRFATECTVSNNTTAIGGNVQLLSG